MRVAVVFDTPYSGWDHPEHARQMEREVGDWKVDEPEMEYQIAHALLECGHEVRLLGVRDDLEYLLRALSDWQPDLVFNGAEAYRGDESLEYLLPG
ncbi:MAG TPA: hypothetical protein VK899_08165, partial [Gemmatimonadales bacterium]|nr:hypothetical protein [Gemmatimonadales bacterium]